MNSFRLTAVGNLARDPEAAAKNGSSYTRFCLVGNDYAGKDEEGTTKEVTTSLDFVAFGPLGETIAQHARKGDQLIVEARVRANNYVDKEGEKKFGHSFIVAREYQLNLPSELDAGRRIELARNFSREIAERYKVAVDLAVHEPRAGGDPRNFHAHLLTTTREVTPAGLGAKAGLDVTPLERRRRQLPDHRQEYLTLRERWATLVNEALREANLTARVDHRSLAAQGIDREPQPRIPLMQLKMEQRGLRSELAERLRGEYRARVQRRLERSAERTALERAGGADAGQRPGESPREHSDAPARPRDVEEIRREAREAWLRMRPKEAERDSEPHPTLERAKDDLAL